MKKRFFFDRKEKNLQIDSEENSFERCKQHYLSWQPVLDHDSAVELNS